MFASRLVVRAWERGGETANGDLQRHLVTSASGGGPAEGLFIASCYNIQKVWEFHSSPSTNLLVSVGQTAPRLHVSVYPLIERDPVLFCLHGSTIVRVRWNSTCEKLFYRKTGQEYKCMKIFMAAYSVSAHTHRPSPIQSPMKGLNSKYKPKSSNELGNNYVSSAGGKLHHC